MELLPSGGISRNGSQGSAGLCSLLFRNSSITQKDQIAGNYPVVSSSGVKSYHNEWRVEGPGVVIGRKGTLGTSFYLEGDFWPHDTTLWVKEFYGNSPLFIYYFLKELELDRYDVGSSNPTLNRNHVHLLPAWLPPVAEQKAITQVLSSLDDKIDLLHRQNKTLEAIAETLFRQWFIEEAQDDWEEGTLGTVADNIRCSVKLSDIQSDGKYIGLEHIDRHEITLKRCGLSGEINSNKYAFEPRDILFGKLRPYFHKVCFTSFLGICSTDILVIRPKCQKWFSFCLFAFFQDEVVEYANLGSGGTRMPRTNWKMLQDYPILIPDDESLTRFNDLVLPSIEKMTYNLTQIQTLEKLRDTRLCIEAEKF